MAKVTVTVYVHSELDFDKKPKYLALGYKQENDAYYSFVCEQQVEIELPRNFDPVLAEINRCNSQINRINEAATASTQELRDRIQNLLALEYTP